MSSNLTPGAFVSFVLVSDGRASFTVVVRATCANRFGLDSDRHHIGVFGIGIQGLRDDRIALVRRVHDYGHGRAIGSRFHSPRHMISFALAPV